MSERNISGQLRKDGRAPRTDMARGDPLQAGLIVDSQLPDGNKPRCDDQFDHLIPDPFVFHLVRGGHADRAQAAIMSLCFDQRTAESSVIDIEFQSGPDIGHGSSIRRVQKIYDDGRAVKSKIRNRRHHIRMRGETPCNSVKRSA